MMLILILETRVLKLETRVFKLDTRVLILETRDSNFSNPQVGRLTLTCGIQCFVVLSHPDSLCPTLEHRNCENVKSLTLLAVLQRYSSVELTVNNVVYWRRTEFKSLFIFCGTSVN